MDNCGIDIEVFDAFTGNDEYNAVYTVQLGELVSKGVFDWDMPILDWKDAAFDEAQYSRVCEYFIERFYYREISLEPFEEWARTLRRKIVFELMPKFKPLYERIGEGINPLQESNEYYKNRTIGSAYPETLLSENADYITDGKDEEYQRLRENEFADSIDNYVNIYRSVDEYMLDELESMFVCMYTANINATW